MTNIEKVIYVEVPVRVKVAYQPGTDATRTDPEWCESADPGEILNHDEIGEVIDKAIFETDWVMEIKDDLDVLADEAVDALDFDDDSRQEHLFVGQLVKRLDSAN